MEKFVDLGVSFFANDFTLDPFLYLKDLYDRIITKMPIVLEV